MSNQDKEEPTFFVSRRGRQVSINQVDLGGIDVEDKPKETVVKKSDKSSKLRPERKGKKTVTWSRRSKFFAISAIVLVLLVPVIVGELVAAQYRSGASDAKTKFVQIVNRSVMPAQKKSDVTANQLQGITNEVDSIVGKMCRGGLLDNMATLYPRANAALKSCKSVQANYAALVGSLRELEKETRYLESVDAAVKSAATPITDEYAVIAVQQEQWTEAATKLSKISPSAEMTAAHEELLAHVKAIAESWSKLATSNNEQNGPAFMEAEKSLATEYEAVRSSSNGFNEVLRSLQSRVTTSYDALR